MRKARHVFKTSLAERKSSQRYRLRHRARYGKQCRRTATKRYITREASPAELDDVAKWLKSARKKNK